MAGIANLEGALLLGAVQTFSFQNDLGQRPASIVVSNDDPTDTIVLVMNGDAFDILAGEVREFTGVETEVELTLQNDNALSVSTPFRAVASTGALCRIVKPNGGPVGTDAIAAGAVTESRLEAANTLGTLGALRVATGVFDPSANVGERTIADHAFGPSLPDNAVVLFYLYEVTTTFTSATDAGTIALGLTTDDANGFKAAIAISAASNPYDAGQHPNAGDIAADATGPNWLVATQTTKLTAARQFNATVAVEALTAGRLVVYAVYIVAAA